jgi:hypothetical protein
VNVARIARGFSVPGEEAWASTDDRSEETASEEETLKSGTVSSGVSGDSPSPGQREEAAAAQSRDRFRVKMWFFCVIGVAVVLISVSASLIGRLSRNGDGTLSASSSSVSHGDGLTMSVNPDTFSERMRVRIDTVPELEFLEGSAGGTLRKAVEALPSHLMVKSPVYQVKVRGEASEPVMIDVVMPNDAEPWETLDLYTWTGEAWEWVGSELHTEVAEHEFIRAEVREVPATLVVMQTDAVGLDVSTTWEMGDNVVASGAGVVDEVNPVGLLLGTEGGFVGEVEGMVQPMGGESYEVVPTVRNWAPDGTVNRGLLSDVLTMGVIREQHIANLVGLCRERGYSGIEIDYRGVGEEEREAYGEFIGALAEGMHKEGLRLNVVMEAAEATNGGWETGGYDWRELGAEADVVKVPFPEDPGVYVEGGQAERLLEWATSQVDRYKLRMMISSLSVERREGEVRTITMEEALAPFGEVMMIKPSEGEAVEFGGEAEFGLSGQVKSITMQEGGGTYRVEYEGESGESRTVWLGTAANLGTKLRWATRYHLGGVAIVDLLDGGNGPGMMEVVASEGNVESGAEGQGMEVVWTVESETATIDQQRTSLTALGYTWKVLASEGEYTVKARIGGYEHGAVGLRVGKPQLEVTEEITASEVSVDGSGTASVTEDCLEGRYVADVTIPDNTQVDGGREFVKTWRVRNSGTCAWPQNTVLARVRSELGGPESIAVGAVPVGEMVEVSITLVAPDDEGVFSGKWVLKVGDIVLPRSGLTAVVRVGAKPGE